MKLIVGLGNIGRQYHNTRHNLGFGVVDMLAITFGKQPANFTKHAKAAAEVLDLRGSNNCMLVRPTTMMNMSGQAVQALAHFYKIPPEDIWVVYDDVDLPFGQMRVRLGGGSAGHNGIKSLIQHIGDGFWRIRLGIANEHLATTPTDKFVLDPFMAEEATKVPELLSTASDYMESALISGSLSDHTQKLW
ncbi:MAG TPA: aminoacyl-tRNA hydrolase, partial [Candidatus Polarisedimenticolaceae bacterium]|nr:aminoacyl-tRNA hydrolase [Candidatus Polarisedimenticolaceae bacterium]